MNKTINKIQKHQVKGATLRNKKNKRMLLFDQFLNKAIQGHNLLSNLILNNLILKPKNIILCRGLNEELLTSDVPV